MRRLLLDGGLVAVVVVAGLLLGADALLGTPERQTMFKMFGSEQEWRHQVLWWWLAALPTAAAIFIRHRRPATAMALAMAGAAMHLLNPALPHLPSDLVTLFTLYALAGAAGSRRLSVAVLVAVETGLYAISLIAAAGLVRGKYFFLTPSSPGLRLWDDSALLQSASQAVVPALLLAVAWTAGDNARTRRAHLATIEARATDLQREQEQRTALAVATERGRITRELHDVVAHGLSVMVVQAQGAEAALLRHPERSQAALANVIATGRASLAEMRRLLSLVRAEPGPQLLPQPSLAALPDLIDRVRASGTPVTFRITGEPLTLPAGVELSAYRIVQEALTNSLKHAGPGTSCSVDLDFTADGLRIRVRDTGTPGPSPVFGNGLRGITERVTALGGTLDAGPADHGGFEVITILPVRTTA